jgi:hypothetical protein
VSETDVTLVWTEIYGLSLKKGLQAGKQQGCYNAQYNVELLCGEMEENGILV